MRTKSYIAVFLFLFSVKFVFAQSTNCVTATSMTLVNNAVCVNGTSTGAITDNTLYGGCNTVPVNMVWYTYVTTGSSNVFTVTPGSLTNCEIVIYLGGCPTTGGVLQLCNTGIGSAVVSSTWGIGIGTQVWIGVASNAGNDGTFQLCVTSTIPPPTGGQFCATPIILCNQNTYTQTSMAQFGSSGQTPNCFANPTQQDMFIQFTVLQTGVLAWTAMGASPVTEYDWCLWNVTAGCPGTEVCCNYNFGAGSSAGFGQQNQAGNVPCGYNLASGIPSQEFSPTVIVTAGQTYQIQISNYDTDDNGFTFNWNNSTCIITPNANFTINPNTVTCAASVNVTINNTSLGGPQVWSYGDGSPNYTGTNPPAHNYTTPGTYAITCTIGGQCPSTYTQYVNLYAPLAATAISSDATCSACNGTASVNSVSGGDGIYTYSWAPGGQTTTSLSGLCAGTYTATVSNAACGTSVQQIVTINSIGTIAASLTASSNILCFGGNTGSATATASAGNGPFSYSWNSVPVQNTQTATGLIAGSYTCTVTSVDGCTITVPVTLTEPPALTLATSGLPNSCNNACDGQLIVIPNGGSPPYAFLWNTGCTNPSCNNICAGAYSITVTDLNGCTQTQAVNVTEPTAITQVLSSTTANCGNNDGSASTIANGGAGSYTYDWQPGNGTAALYSNLTPGQYTCTVTDANGCTSIDSIVVANTAGINITSGPIVNATCNGVCDGSLSATGNGGAPPYAYLWSPSGGNASTATNLCAGSYTCSITDANACVNTISFVVTEPTQLTVTTPAVPPVICTGTNTNLSAIGNGGTPPYTYLWQPGALPGNAPAVTPATSTTYTVTITDSNGCTNSATELITVNPTPLAALSGLPLSGCAPLTVVFSDLSTVTAPGVITSWLWDFGDLSSSTSQNPTHTYFNAGSYNVTLTIISTGGCTATITMNNYVIVNPSPVAGFSASPQPTTTLEATVTFTDLSTGATTWQWNFGDVGNSTSTLQSPSFPFPDTGCYVVQQIVTDANSCTDTAESVICIQPDWAIYVPNAFTPDNDGINELFLPLGVGIDEEHFEMWIFDRWGNMIYYTTDFHQGWNGKANGGSEIAQIDTYVWRIKCKDILGGAHKYIGKVSLIK